MFLLLLLLLAAAPCPTEKITSPTQKLTGSLILRPRNYYSPVAFQKTFLKIQLRKLTMQVTTANTHALCICHEHERKIIF